MDWGQIVRHSVTAIGITFVVAAGFYLAIRLLMLGL
jgi:hypothetical protein